MIPAPFYNGTDKLPTDGQLVKIRTKGNPSTYWPVKFVADRKAFVAVRPDSKGGWVERRSVASNDPLSELSVGQVLDWKPISTLPSEE